MELEIESDHERTEDKTTPQGAQSESCITGCPPPWPPFPPYCGGCASGTPVPVDEE